jgi:uncharacterized repeat protein (TIGR01451 family)
VLLALASMASALGQGTLEVSKSIQGDLTSVPSGSEYTYILNYRYASQTQNGQNVKLEDNLDPDLSWTATEVIMGSSTHIASMAYTAATGKAVWTFVNPLPAGSSGQLTLKVRFKSGITANGTVATNSAVMTANNAATVHSTPISISATASHLQTALKSRTSGGTPGYNTVYTLAVRNPTGGTVGALALTNATVIDPLPVGAEFVSATGGGTYDAPNHRVVWTNVTAAVGSNNSGYSATVTVRYPSGTFTVGQSVCNTMTVTGNAVGLVPVSLSDEECYTPDRRRSRGHLVQQDEHRHHARGGADLRLSHHVLEHRLGPGGELRDRGSRADQAYGDPGPRGAGHGQREHPGVLRAFGQPRRLGRVLRQPGHRDHQHQRARAAGRGVDQPAPLGTRHALARLRFAQWHQRPPLHRDRAGNRPARKPGRRGQHVHQLRHDGLLVRRLQLRRHQLRRLHRRRPVRQPRGAQDHDRDLRSGRGSSHHAHGAEPERLHRRPRQPGARGPSAEPARIRGRQYHHLRSGCPHFRRTPGHPELRHLGPNAPSLDLQRDPPRRHGRALRQQGRHGLLQGEGQSRHLARHL